MIVIDPRYTDTAAGREDEWIPIRPGTDAALVAGIALVLINENLVDQPFLDNYCIGYDEKTLPADAPPMAIIRLIFWARARTVSPNAAVGVTHYRHPRRSDYQTGARDR